jgi:hypothetical protein
MPSNRSKVHPADPKTTRAAKQVIMRYTAQCDLESPLAVKFLNEGFANVQLSYNYGQNLWEFKAARGTNQDCQTPERVKEIIGRLVRELGHEIDRGLIVALVLDDRIASRFKLRSKAQPV